MISESVYKHRKIKSNCFEFLNMSGSVTIVSCSTLSECIEIKKKNPWIWLLLFSSVLKFVFLLVHKITITRQIHCYYYFKSFETFRDWQYCITHLSTKLIVYSYNNTYQHIHSLCACLWLWWHSIGWKTENYQEQEETKQ
jgi:hypothetical protein